MSKSHGSEYSLDTGDVLGQAKEASGDDLRACIIHLHQKFMKPRKCNDLSEQCPIKICTDCTTLLVT
jgi:hypothetical protein